MTFRAAPLSLVLVLLVAAVPPAFGQDPPPKTAADHFKDARDLISGGNYELAAEALERFLAATPTDDQVLDIETKFGPTAYLRLRNVIKWSENKDENAKALATVEAVIKRQQLASTNKFKNPARIRDLVLRLGSFREERLYAEGQLKLAGVAAMPELFKTFRSSNKAELQAAILSLLPKMPVETVPYQVAVLDGLTEAEKLLVVGAITAREDVLTLVTTPETDFLPFLWYHASDPGAAKSSLRDAAAATLERFFGPIATKTKAEAALTSLAEPIAAGKAKYRVQDPKDAPAGAVRVWTYDPKTLQVSSQDVSRLVADEYFGLKYLRWALERNPKYLPAQRLFTSFATERAVERAKFGELSRSEPAVYQLLAAAPAELLVELLDTALADGRTALALGMVQALGDRAHKDAATAPGAAATDRHPSPLVRALTYNDPRVKFAAAVALARQPGPPTHGKSAKVVEILKQALAADADGSGTGTVGRALIADPDAVRGEGLALMFRSAGYAAERYASGRQLVARLAKASDFDLIVIDRHVADPLLADTLTQVAADTNAARRPVFVVASADKVQPLPLEILLLRLANIVAATDDGVIQQAGGSRDYTPQVIVIPPPFAFDPNKPVKDRDEAKRKIVTSRDGGMVGPSDAEKAAAIEEATKDGKPAPSFYAGLFEHRLGRLKRLVLAADLPTSQDLADRLALRLPQLVLAGLVAEYDATADTAPRTVSQLEQATRALVARRELAASAATIPDLGNLQRLLEQLDAKLTPEQKERLGRIQNRTLPSQLALPTGYQRDAAMEEKLAGQTKRFKSTHVLSAPFSAEYLKADIEQAIPDPALRPRDPAERLASTKIAVDLLRRMSLGELPGYDIRPAEAELRAALFNPATAETAIDAVARLESRSAQEDLIKLAISADPLLAAVRTKAADAGIRHVQAFGKRADDEKVAPLVAAAPAEADLTLRAKLSTLAQLLAGKPGEFGAILQKFPVRLTAPQPPAPKMPPEKKPEDPKM